MDDLNLTPEDPNEVPERPCTANLSLANNPPCLKNGRQVAATHIITGPDGRSQWWGCAEHTAEALELECTAEPWPEWYDRNILGGRGSLQKWMNENA